MKPSAMASCAADFARFVLRRLLAFILAFYAPLACPAAVPEVLMIRQAEFIMSDAAAPPADDAGWQTVALPHRLSKPADRDLAGYWYRARFVLPPTQQPLYLYFSKLHSGGTIVVNGFEVANIPGSSESARVRSFRPHLFLMPRQFLASGNNLIAVKFATREPLTGFSEFSVGPQQPLQDRFEFFLFWQYTSAEISAVVCSILGALIIVFWLRRREEQLYGIFGTCVFFWGARTFISRIQEVPMAYWDVWRFFYYLTTGGFIVFMTIFLLKFSEVRRFTFTRILLGYWLIGCLAFILVGAPLRRFMDLLWLTGFLPFAIFAILQLILFAYRARTASSISMAIAIAPTLAFTLHDHAMVHGMLRLDEFYLMHLGIPVFLLVMGWVMSNHFLDSLRQVESSNERLKQRIEAREKELNASFENLRKLERDQAIREERQRIMEDMHDGLGSQILSTLVMVQRGGATQASIMTQLQECLDDMRLVIEAIGQPDTDLLPVLGNFRFRMESRFKSMGIALNWHNQNMPDSLQMAPPAALHLLRILQESLANVLKHANATSVDVDVGFASDHMQIRIKDNGDGFTKHSMRGSHGLANMEMRAKKIGAQLSIDHSASGTLVEVRVPLDQNSAIAVAS